MRPNAQRITPEAELNSIARLLRTIEGAERTILACVLLRPGAYAFIRETLTEVGFEVERHRLIWQVVEDCVEGGIEPDLVNVRRELERRGKLDDAGGPTYLAHLDESFVRSDNYDSYCGELRSVSARLSAVRAAEELGRCATNGTPGNELVIRLRKEADRIERVLSSKVVAGARPLIQSEPQSVEFAVHDLLPRNGLAMLYGEGGAGKTYFLLALVTEMLAAKKADVPESPAILFGCANLAILRRWRRVAWVSAEESAGVLRSRWDRVLAGMRDAREAAPNGLLYRWAFEVDEPFTLDNVDGLLESTGGRIDALVLDSWTSLVPSIFEGRPVEWDRDNFAARRLLNRLRAIAERREILIIVVHHTGKNPESGPRGPSEFRNSVDVLLSLTKQPQGKVLLRVEKQREGRDRWELSLGMTFEGSSVRVQHGGVGASDLSLRERIVFDNLEKCGKASVAELTKRTGQSRATVQRALAGLSKQRRVKLTGEKSNSRSPIWGVIISDHGVPTDATRTF